MIFEIQSNKCTLGQATYYDCELEESFEVIDMSEKQERFPF